MASNEDIGGKISEGSTSQSSCYNVSSTSEEEDDDSQNSTGGGGDKRKFEEGEESSEADEGSKKPKMTGAGFLNVNFKNVKGGRGQDKKSAAAPISIKLGAQKPKEAVPPLKRTSMTVANVFNQDSDEEEMPPEAKMRMRNIGRDTPTSAGPNSFGKTRQGFCDMKKVFEKQLKKQMDDIGKK